MKPLLLVMLLMVLMPQITLHAISTWYVTAFEPAQCSGQFIRHELAHITHTNQIPVRLFDSNGSGLAIQDLNDDGWLDIVFANLDGEETLLWNEGQLQFRRQALPFPGRTRSVIILDVDGDGLRDIVMSGQRSAPSFWRNQGDETFELGFLAGVSKLTYAMNWGDLDGDGDLDLVTGSYNAELEQLMTNQTLFGNQTGIFYYENQDGSFVPTQLSERSQALAIFFADLDDDAQLDIAIGNDFTEPDRFWSRQAGEWTEIHPFTVMSYSTMSYDVGDLNNDGDSEWAVMDMHPYSDDPVIQESWQPFLDRMALVPMLPDDPQTMINTVQVRSGDAYNNQSVALGLSATGWSWSGKFGDLNSDGLLDFYVVNGMIASDLFPHLPDGALIETNQAFRNVEGSRFVPVPEWQLGDTASGRGMSMADMDNDGDLDIVVNNLLSSAVLYENQLCGGDNLIVKLVDTTAHNRDGIGAQLTLGTSNGTFYRDIRASSGYLSGDPAQAHFGLPTDTDIHYLAIRWADGDITQIEQIESNQQITINRS